MAGRTARVAATGAKKLTSKVWRKSSSVMSTSRTPGSCAALLTSRSTGPCAAATSSSARRRAAVSATSQVMVPDPGAEGAQVGRQLLEPLGVAGQADDGGTGPGQVDRELGAQAGRGAGDHGHLALVAPAEVGRAAGRGRSGSGPCAVSGSRGRRVRQLLEVGPQPGRRLGQHVLAGHQRRQVAPHPHAPGRQRVRRVELPRAMASASA